jgi:tetratricopeptide (TPR) repeat protein
MADRVGEQFGDYTLIRMLGEGTFGEVYLAEHIYLRTQAAVKVLHTKLEENELQGFLDEARKIAVLSHPNIVRLVGFSMHNRTPYLVMQLAPNNTLRKRHPRGTRLPLATILLYVRQCAEALQHAHDHSLIHLDLKPENMLIGEKGEIVLADFGIAKVLQQGRSHQTVGSFSGTPAYAAPEQFQNKPGFASDQYALAVVVYEWLTGTWPFEGDGWAIGVQKMTQEPFPLRTKVPQLSPQVEQVVMKALSREPKARYGSVSEFAKALEAAAQFEGAVQTSGDQQQATAFNPAATFRGVTPSGVPLESFVKQPISTPISTPQAASIPPVVYDTKEEWNRVAKAHSKAGHHQEALDAYNRAVALDPEDEWGYANRAETLVKLERYPEAIADFSRALDINAFNDWAWAHRGEAHRLAEHYPEALSDFQRALNLDPKYIWVLMSRGQVYEALKDYPRAVEAFSRVVEIDPQESWGYAHRGEAHRLMKRNQDALQDFSRAIAIKSTYAWAYGSRGQVYLSLNEYHQAILDLDRAIALDSSLSWAWAHRGEAHRLLESYHQAIADFDEAIKRYQQYSWAYARRGEAYRQVGKFEEAVRDCMQALELNPNNDFAYGVRGATYRAMKHYQRAIDDLSRALELDPNDAWDYGQRGKAFAGLKDYERAIADFDRALALQPDLSWVVESRNQARLHLKNS